MCCCDVPPIYYYCTKMVSREMREKVRKNFSDGDLWLMTELSAEPNILEEKTEKSTPHTNQTRKTTYDECAPSCKLQIFLATIRSFAQRSKFKYNSLCVTNFTPFAIRYSLLQVIGVSTQRFFHFFIVAVCGRPYAIWGDIWFVFACAHLPIFK